VLSQAQHCDFENRGNPDTTTAAGAQNYKPRWFSRFWHAFGHAKGDLVYGLSARKWGRDAELALFAVISVVRAPASTWPSPR
jgi:hypothetical protein